MSLIKRRTYFLLLCLLVFVNLTGFLWEQQRSRRYETNVYGNSARELKLARRSVSPEGSDPALAETNPIDFRLSEEGDDIEPTQREESQGFNTRNACVAASDFFCPNLNTIASSLNLSESMAGVTFLAFGNGSPDVFSTFSAMSNNSGSLAVGELIGAAAFISSVVAGVIVIGSWRVSQNKRHRWLEQRARDEYAPPSEDSIIEDNHERDEETGHNTTPISMTALNRNYNIGDSYFSPSSFITMNDIVDQTSFHHHHGSKQRSLHNGMRPSLFGAIEFRDLVKSLKLNSSARALGVFGRSYSSEFNDSRIQRPRIERSHTTPLRGLYENPRAGIDNIYDAFGLSGNNNTARRGAPSLSPDLSPYVDIDQYSEANLQSHETQSDSSNTLQVPRLNLVPPTPSRGRSPLLSPLQVSYSPPSMTADSEPPVDGFPQYLQSPPSPVTPLPSPVLSADVSADVENPVNQKSYVNSIWEKIQPTLFPSLTGFGSKSLFAKFIALLACPAILLLVLTLPVVEADKLSGDNEKRADDSPITSHADPPQIILEHEDNVIDLLEDTEGENGWSRWLTTFQLVFAPVFVVGVFVATNDFDYKAILYAFVVGSILSVLYIKTTDDNRPPSYYTLFCFAGFAVAIVWIFIVANEVVGVLQAIGLIMGLSDAILGLTIFAMGNSLGDFVANITIARMGFPMMAMSACFGGPMLNILLGIGISGTYVTLKTQEPYRISVSPTLFVSSIGLFIALASSLVYLPNVDYWMTRRWGYYLIGLYITCMIINVVIELVGIGDIQ
ncbi:9139_t:CDS:10 [Paraglomus occultum]|uniref:9139_t:CDS:1 n=1 Tax=Paraglomus occultum TaxID=144539 RepID=A0A9N8ZC26_9GLOM|nr:9139_t:CDS:10 [Paraglomus occultum]